MKTFLKKKRRFERLYCVNPDRINSPPACYPTGTVTKPHEGSIDAKLLSENAIQKIETFMARTSPVQRATTDLRTSAKKAAKNWPE
ncbi:MAG: hypothetical protein H7240_02195 [Glaciimonas sp.]|nr:hypothetical protein [Glaciimonas sp.]